MIDEKAVYSLKSLLSSDLFDLWSKLQVMIESKYETDTIFGSGGKKWTYEYKYRRGGKTLCDLYAKENCVGFMVIFGKLEREKFEEQRQSFSEEIQKIYDESATFHDGKWMMFLPTDTSMFKDYEKLLAIKRKPNKK